jgi:hypothetical protein
MFVALATGVACFFGAQPFDCANARALEKTTNVSPSTAEWRIVPPATAQVKDMAIALPPLATVESRDDSGRTWRLSGKAHGSPSVVQQDFKLCFTQQGWRLDKVMPLGRARASDLLLWKKGKQSMMLMLWEDGAGRSGFALGRIE